MKILKTTFQWLVIVIFLALACLMVRKQIYTTELLRNTELPVVKSVPEESGSSHINEAGSNISNAPVDKQRHPGDVAIVNHWFKLKGYSVEGENAYEVYSDEQLQEMMKQGDITAFDTLSGRYISQGDPRAVKIAEQSISYGSLNGISRTKGKFPRYISADDSPEERVQAKQNLKMRLSYLQLLSLRGAGELYSIHIVEKVELDHFREIYGEEPLTPEDYQWISKKAQELYDHYQSERYKLGLGDFDNEMPSEVKKFLGLQPY